MAITTNRTTNKNLTTLVKTNFISVTDRTKDLPPNSATDYTPKAASSKIAAIIGKKNIFSKTPPVTLSKAAAGLGVFPVDGKPLCAGDVPNVVPAQQADRLLTAPSTIGSCTPTINSNLVSTSALAHITEGLPENKVLALEGMLKAEISKHSRLTKYLSNINLPDSVSTGMTNLKNSLSPVGSVLKDKVNLKALLSCDHNSGANGNESNTISKNVTDGLLSQAVCMSPAKLLNTASDLSTLGNVPYSSILSSVTKAMVNSKDKTAADKLSMVAALPGLLPTPTAGDIATVSSSLDGFMKDIGGSAIPDNLTSKDFITANVALDTIDPNWNKDTTGKLNLAKSKNNTYIEAIHKKQLTASSVSSTSITNTPTALQPTDSKYMSILVVASNVVKKSIVNGSLLRVAGYNG